MRAYHAVILAALCCTVQLLQGQDLVADDPLLVHLGGRALRPGETCRNDAGITQILLPATTVVRLLSDSLRYGANEIHMLQFAAKLKITQHELDKINTILEAERADFKHRLDEETRVCQRKLKQERKEFLRMIEKLSDSGESRGNTRQFFLGLAAGAAVVAALALSLR